MMILTFGRDGRYGLKKYHDTQEYQIPAPVRLPKMHVGVIAQSKLAQRTPKKVRLTPPKSSTFHLHFASQTGGL